MNHPIYINQKFKKLKLKIYIIHFKLYIMLVSIKLMDYILNFYNYTNNFYISNKVNYCRIKFI